MRAQAVPLETHQRGVALARARRQLVVLLAIGLCLCTVSPAALGHTAPRTGRALTGPPFPLIAPSRPAQIAVAATDVVTTTLVLARDLENEAADRDVTAAVIPVPLVVADARTSTSHLDEAGLFNALAAISFVDGVVIPAGERLVFDDVARTWDYREDSSYVMGRATSVRGFVNMRGGGVCTVSTAVWRAALAAGLRTDRRQSHYGLLEPDNPGLDATNTLVIANDSNEAVTVHVWLDADTVRAQLLADSDLDRVATVSEPTRSGNGRWLVEQEVTWADGRQTTNRFASLYYW